MGRFANGRMVPAPSVDLPALVRSAPLVAAPPSPWSDGVLADPIPPPVPTSPPPLVPTQVDNPPEAYIPPPLPAQAGNEDLTVTPALPDVEQGPSADASDSASIMAVSTTPNADGGYDVRLKNKPGWTDAQRTAADAKVAALHDATRPSGCLGCSCQQGRSALS